LGENRAGCPLTPEVCDRWRSANSGVLGAAPWARHCRLEHADQIPLVPVAPAGNRAVVGSARRSRVLEETQETEELIERVAALDVGKAELTCCVRVPAAQGSGRRLQEVKTYPTMTRSLLAMADRLAELG
jgi:acyl-CoA synthetase (NDP forming)